MIGIHIDRQECKPMPQGTDADLALVVFPNMYIYTQNYTCSNSVEFEQITNKIFA